MAKKKKTVKDEIVEELIAKEKKAQHIKLGFDIQDFFRTNTGKILEGLWEQKIAIALKEMTLSRYPKLSQGKPHPQAGQFECQTLAEFERARGFALGIQWVLQDVATKVGRAQRLERERKKEEKDKPET